MIFLEVRLILDQIENIEKDSYLTPEDYFSGLLNRARTEFAYDLRDDLFEECDFTPYEGLAECETEFQEFMDGMRSIKNKLEKKLDIHINGNGYGIKAIKLIYELFISRRLEFMACIVGNYIKLDSSEFLNTVYNEYPEVKVLDSKESVDEYTQNNNDAMLKLERDDGVIYLSYNGIKNILPNIIGSVLYGNLDLLEFIPSDIISKLEEYISCDKTYLQLLIDVIPADPTIVSNIYLYVCKEYLDDMEVLLEIDN